MNDKHRSNNNSGHPLGPAIHTPSSRTKEKNEKIKKRLKESAQTAFCRGFSKKIKIQLSKYYDLYYKYDWGQ